MKEHLATASAKVTSTVILMLAAASVGAWFGIVAAFYDITRQLILGYFQ